jgi:Flp pilus assembly pilin Flp
MYSCLKQLWDDDEGALLATEWLIMATIPVMGVAAGMTSVRNSVNSELNQFGNSVSALNQSYSYPGLSGAGSNVAGAAVVGTSSLGAPITMGPPPAPTVSGNLPTF